MMAQDSYEALQRELLISRTGHAAAGYTDLIIEKAGGKHGAVLMECDAAGYPLADEKWEAKLFDDGSALIGTYVRGRRSTYFWKPVENIKAFDIWEKW